MGGGPVGIHLAALLAQAGLDVRVWEARAEPALLSRAIGIHAPALDAFDRLGVADEMVAEAVLVRHGIAMARGREHRAGLVRRRVDVPPVRRGAAAVAHGGDPRAAPRRPRPGRAPARGDAHRPRRGSRRGRPAAPCARRAPTPTDGPWRRPRPFVVGADGTRGAVRGILGIAVDERPLPDRFLMGDAPDTTDGGDDAVITLHPDGVVESFPLPGRHAPLGRRPPGGGARRRPRGDRGRHRPRAHRARRARGGPRIP
ncbi:FAD-dependent monooxygenase [Clavibacter zhangzhiyongii]|uniref:FAD-dependent monooxygenase n=1 Tax=Clavibacter zhangzhiyongii TaxID=2768071 RepID=UPI0039E1C0E7